MARYQVFELVTMTVIHEVEAETQAEAIAKASARGPLEGEMESVDSTEWASVWRQEGGEWKPATE